MSDLASDAQPETGSIETEGQPDPTPARVRVTNNLRAAAVTLTVDGIDPGRVVLAQGASLVVPVAFWDAWRAMYTDSDFNNFVTAVPVD